MRCKKRICSVLALVAIGYASSGANAASDTAGDGAGNPSQEPTVEQFRSALSYYTGESTTRDHPLAREMLAPLAEQGVAPAQYLYAYMLIFGQGGEQNLQEGIRVLQLAVVRGHPAAMKLLGDLYAKGEGVPQDNRQAVQFYQLAANLGHAPAQFSLGAFYDQGKGLTENPAEAARWILRAANQGFAPAMRNAAILYFNGRGLTRDPARAFAWLELAYRNFPEGSSERDAVLQIHNRLEATLTPEDLNEANVFVEGWSASQE